MEKVEVMRLFHDYYRGRRVLVTGHTGFTGTWLCHWLLEMGASVTGYSKTPATTPALFTLAGTAELIDHHIGDINDRTHLAAVVAAARPDAIFHLAAQPIVAESYIDPVGTMQTNAIGTANLLEVIRTNPWPGLSAVVVITTDKVYGDGHGDRALREDDPLGAGDPYSSSKAMAELVFGTYVRLFALSESTRRLRLACVRAGNIFGGGDWSPRRLIPDSVDAILGGAPIRLRCPQAIRPWQFMLEAIAGYLQLLAAMDTEPTVPSGEGWNFGPDSEGMHTVESIATRLLAIGGRDPFHSIEVEPESWNETPILRLDSAKARRLLGWRTTLPIDEALRWTFAFYQAIHAGATTDSVRQLIGRQIRDYDVFRIQRQTERA